MKLKIFKKIEELGREIKQMREEVDDLKKQLSKQKMITKANLLRIKNCEPMGNDLINYERTYNDLSPSQSLERFKDSENDQIISLYTLEKGKQEVLARGVKKITSKNSAHLEPFSFVEVEIVPILREPALVSDYGI